MKKNGLFLLIFMLFASMPSFASDIRIFWTTARPTVAGINPRVIPMSSVKAEFFRSWDEYAYVIHTDKNVYERDFYTRLSEMFPSMGPGDRQFSNWLKSNQNFVFAYSSQSARGVIIICFVTRHWVYEISFNIFGTGLSTNNRERRRSFDAYVDDILRGM